MLSFIAVAMVSLQSNRTVSKTKVLATMPGETVGTVPGILEYFGELEMFSAGLMVMVTKTTKLCKA